MSQSVFTGFQAGLFDPVAALPKDELADLESGWAGEFRRTILPVIVQNERLFASLYSQRRDTRPAVPTYILLAALLLQQVWVLNDRQIFEKIQSDLAWQYALGTENWPVQPISRSSLTRFRALIKKGKKRSGQDYLQLFYARLSFQLSSKTLRSSVLSSIPDRLASR